MTELLDLLVETLTSGKIEIIVLMAGLAFCLLSFVSKIGFIIVLDKMRSYCLAAGISLVVVGVALGYLQSPEKPVEDEVIKAEQEETPGPGIPNSPSGEGYVVHVSSVSKQSTARNVHVEVRNQNEEALKDYASFIQPILTADKKKMYRVNFGTFEKQIKAEQVCLQIRKSRDFCDVLSFDEDNILIDE